MCILNQFYKAKYKTSLLYFLPETTNPLEKDSSNAGAIAGGVIGTCVVLFVIVGILFLRYHAGVI